jgi:hypothetical protein
MFISILSTYSYNMGAHRRWACKRFIKNTISCRFKLIKRLFYCFILNQAKACPTPSKGVAHVRSGVSIVNMPWKGWWGCLWNICVRVDGTFRTIPTIGIPRQKFFIPAQTLIGVFLFKTLSWAILLFLNMLLVSSYIMTARQQQWMPFWLPLPTAGKGLL